MSDSDLELLLTNQGVVMAALMLLVAASSGMQDPAYRELASQHARTCAIIEKNRRQP